MKSAVTFSAACAAIETLVTGTARQEILAGISHEPGHALTRLRAAMQANAWEIGARLVNLDLVARTFDDRTRQDGFHALHDWDGKADRVNQNTIPVDVLDYLGRERESPDDAALAILLDYYVFHLLALLSLRIWDDGDANENLERLDRLLGNLQGADGSGQRFASDSETLILIATSHYEPHERGYGTLLDRVRTLNRSHRAAIALGHAESIGCHLRFGFEATYGRDVGTMRADNVADYPWLSFSLATLMDEYSRTRDAGVCGNDREAVVEAMLNGLSPDAGAFAGGQVPGSLALLESERAAFQERYDDYRHDLIDEFEGLRPSDLAYSPLSFFFNFSHNVVKGTVIDALLWGQPWTLTLNDLLTGVPRDESNAEAKIRLANTLMGYARSSPDRIGGRLMPAIVYDPLAGRRAFAATMRALRA